MNYCGNVKSMNFHLTSTLSNTWESMSTFKIWYLKGHTCVKRQAIFLRFLWKSAFCVRSYLCFSDKKVFVVFYPGYGWFSTLAHLALRVWGWHLDSVTLLWWNSDLCKPLLLKAASCLPPRWLQGFNPVTRLQKASQVK